MQSREKIKPILDVPLILQMETVSGQESSSQFNGLEYRYNVVHEDRPSIIYLPAEGRDAIVRARPVPGDYVELLKQKRGKQFVFQAQVLSDAREMDEEAPEYEEPPPARPAPRPSHGAARQLTYDEAEALGLTNPPARPRLVAPARAALPPAPQQRSQQPPSRPPANGHQATGQALPPRPDDLTVSPIAQQVAGCLRVAVDAWEEIRQYARERYGVEIEYTAEDIRATGTSVYINNTGGRK